MKKTIRAKIEAQQDKVYTTEIPMAGQEGGPVRVTMSLEQGYNSRPYMYWVIKSSDVELGSSNTSHLGTFSEATKAYRQAINFYLNEMRVRVG